MGSDTATDSSIVCWITKDLAKVPLAIVDWAALLKIACGISRTMPSARPGRCFFTRVFRSRSRTSLVASGEMAVLKFWILAGARLVGAILTLELRKRFDCLGGS